MRQFDTDSTICAIASAVERAERGIVRISGPDSVEICSRWITAEQAEQFTLLKTAKRFEVNLCIERFNQRVPASLMIWPGSRSYTGQPSVEIHTVGNLLLLEMIVEQLLASGAKSAQPGEFTYRAFLNGRLDLTQCEAVLAVIHSTHEKALDISLRQLAGGLSQPLAAVRRDLINLLADLEAGLDFVEEDIQFVSSHEVRCRLQDSLRILDEVVSQLGSRRTASRSAKVVLAGLPNAGKSSLINALVGNEIAIVSEQSGTTRDFVRATLECDNGCSLHLIDTAGLETIDGTVQSIASKSQERTQNACGDADLILFCCDGSDSENLSEQIHWLEQIRGAKTTDSELWLVATKSDLSPNMPMNDRSRFDRQFVVSSLTGQGVSEIHKSLGQWVIKARAVGAEVVPMTLVRCSESVTRARLAISEALVINQNVTERSQSGADEEMSFSDVNLYGQEELIAAEIRNALHELGAVVGEVYTDDVLDALFSRFCIGK